MVRIDRFLQHVQIVPSRKDAKKLLDDGLVLINNKLAKPSSKLNNDDIIIIYLETMTVKLQAKLEKKENTIYVGYEILERIKREIAIC